MFYVEHTFSWNTVVPRTKSEKDLCSHALWYDVICEERKGVSQGSMSGKY